MSKFISAYYYFYHLILFFNNIRFDIILDLKLKETVL